MKKTFTRILVIAVSCAIAVACAQNSEKKQCETQCDGTKAEQCDECHKGECHKGECHKGECQKGECHKGECQKGECQEGECQK